VLYGALPNQGLEQKVTEIRFFLRLLCFAALDCVAKYASYSSLECLLDERFKRIFASFLQQIRSPLIREFIESTTGLGALDLDDSSGLRLNCDGQQI
jgi:hypothetical protein